MPPGTDIDWQDPAYEAAAEWVVRLHGSVSDAQAETDWQAFETWLDAAPGHRAAYDDAEALWSDIGRQARPIRGELSVGRDATIFPFPARKSSPTPIWWAASAAAAAAALLVVGPFSPFLSASPALYSTAKGERRMIDLSDGSRIMLNSGSKLSVLIEGKRREATLAEGSEAAFTIVHDARRPFAVHVGDRTVRDLGTEFDVLRADGALRVTVRSGLVEIVPAAGSAGDAMSVAPNRVLKHREGSARSEVTAVSADDAFSWRSGRLIYRNAPLGEVAADLSRNLSTPVRVEGAASTLRFSGVLEIGNEPAAIERLAALVPVSANSKDGVIILQERGVSR